MAYIFTIAVVSIIIGICIGAPTNSQPLTSTVTSNIIVSSVRTTTSSNTLLTSPVPPAIVGKGGIRRFSQYSRGRGYRDWRTRGDPTLINSLWRHRQPLGIRKQLGNAEVYIVLALLIGFVTVVIGCWLSDNCWSPDPEDAVS